jgi:hypothetical protein
MKDLKERAEDFAQRMANELFIMRAESDFTCAEQIPDKFRDKILDDPEHIKNMKALLHKEVLIDALETPDNFVTDADGNFVYSHDACYDYVYLVDNYIETEFENARQARLKIRYKVWVEIERIEYDPETDTETYHDEDNPVALAYEDSIEDAVELQTIINDQYGRIS